MFKKGFILLFAFVVLSILLAPVAYASLPIKVPANLVEKNADIRNKISGAQINNIIGPDEKGKGLIIDLKDSSLQGTIYTGPYPFEVGIAPGASDYDYFRFRKSSSLKNGKGLLRISDFYKDKYNANNWPEGQGWKSTPTIAYRLDLWRTKNGKVEHLGFYDSVVSFEKDGKTFKKVTTILEGPFVSLVRSDDPTKLMITWTTDVPCKGTVHIKGLGNFSENKEVKDHEVEIKGLKPASIYKYYITCDSTVSPLYTLYTAPEPGKTDSDKVIKVAFAGDSREGVGGGERNYMGVNYKILSWIARSIYRENVDFMIFGGDLVNGYTTEPEDFRLQLTAWKQAVSGFWRSHPVYPGMGNHETLLKYFTDGKKYGIGMDRWPYETQSAEAVFAKLFHNPTNGPIPSDPRRPTYKENVYSFQYGPLFVISFNNNYWFTSRDKVEDAGGSPEGYIMEDQLEWIEKQLEKAKNDPTVKYIIMYAQEPVFPCGGHTKDAMWYYGNNKKRAYTYNEKTGKIEPERLGIIEVRDRLWKDVANNPKVAAVLGADEHEYYRVLITKDTPVDPVKDVNGDGKFEEEDEYAPNKDFTYPTWFITAGTGGAPYYSRQWTPWKPVILSSQHGYLLIEATDEKISAKFVSFTGQIVDKIDDLMSIKKR